MSDATRIYRGTICRASNGEEDDLVGLLGEDHRVVILAEEIRDNKLPGDFWSVRYFVTDRPIPAEEVVPEMIRTLYGSGSADYGMRWSELTGYLYTDEELEVGGHDLIKELRSHMCKFLHMEITFSTEAKP